MNLESLSLSTDGQRPYSTASQAVTRASATNTRRIRAVAPSSSKNVWQALARGEEAEAESTGGAAFVAYDANGAPHQKYRAPSTVDDEDSSETTTLDTKEQLRLAHEEVCMCKVSCSRDRLTIGCRKTRDPSSPNQKRLGPERFAPSFQRTRKVEL